MKKWAQKQSGFTIVELLIVVVVIAILAAITIVAYNGIQNRTKQSAAQSLLSQANKKILSYAIQNSDLYPTSLEQAGINNTDNMLEYSYNNDSSPRTYGLTATNGNYSYYVSNTVAQPTSGGYAGHNANGIAAITNLVNNPNFESANSSWASSAGTGGAGAATRLAAGGVGNSAYYRYTWSTPATSGTPYITNGSGGASARNINVLSDQAYVASGWVRSSWATKVSLSLTAYDASDTSVRTVTGTAVDLVPNTWTRISNTITTNPTAATMVVRYVLASAGVSGMVAGSTLDIDQVMFTQGTTLYDYADGNSLNWVWTGATNLSTSKGPPNP